MQLRDWLAVACVAMCGLTIVSAFDSTEIRMLEDELPNADNRIYSRFEDKRSDDTAGMPLIRFGKRAAQPLIRFGRTPQASPIIRFGKRASPAGSPLIRFGRSAGSPLIRFGRSAGSPLIRFGRTPSASPLIRFGRK